MATGTTALSKLHSEGSVGRKMEPGRPSQNRKEMRCYFWGSQLPKMITNHLANPTCPPSPYLLLAPVNIAALNKRQHSGLGLRPWPFRFPGSAGSSLAVRSLRAACGLGRVAVTGRGGWRGAGVHSGPRSARWSSLGCPPSAQLPRAWVPCGQGWMPAPPPFLSNF